jgi:hypothetical protein
VVDDGGSVLASGSHGQADHERDIHGHAGQGGVRQGEQPQQRCADGQPGQQHSAAGGVERGDGGLFGCLPGEQPVAVPADDEQLLIMLSSRDTPPGRSLGVGARGAAGSADRAEPTRAGCHERYWLISLLSA